MDSPCSGSASRAVSRLLQIQRLVVTRGVELRAPDLVHALVLGAAELNRRSQADVQIVHAFEARYQILGVDVGTGLLQCGDQNVGGHLAFQRDESGRPAHAVPYERLLSM